MIKSNKGIAKSLTLFENFEEEWLSTKDVAKVSFAQSKRRSHYGLQR